MQRYPAYAKQLVLWLGQIRYITLTSIGKAPIRWQWAMGQSPQWVSGRASVRGPRTDHGQWWFDSRLSIKSYCAGGLIPLGKATDHGAVTKAPDICLGKIHPYYICTISFKAESEK